MKMSKVTALAEIAQPVESDGGFVADLRFLLSYCFRPGQGCPAGLTQVCLKYGIDLLHDLPPEWEKAQTALD